MSLRPQQPIPPVPGDAARATRAAFGMRNPYLILRDRLGTLFTDRPLPQARPASLCAVAAGAGHAHAVLRGVERPAGGVRPSAPGSTGHTCLRWTLPTRAVAAACRAGSTAGCWATRPLTGYPRRCSRIAWIGAGATAPTFPIHAIRLRLPLPAWDCRRCTSRVRI